MKKRIPCLLLTVLLFLSLLSMAYADDGADAAVAAEENTATAGAAAPMEEPLLSAQAAATEEDEVTASAVEVAEDFAWDLTDGVLTVSGTGAMPDYDYSSSSYAPWYENRSSITRVVVEPGITTVGIDAFLNCTKLTSVSLPEGLTAIHGDAFYNCSSLPNIQLPTTVNGIYDSAFYGCTALTQVDLSEGLELIHVSAFSGCTALPSIELPSTVKSVYYHAFYNCTSLSSVTLSTSLETLGAKTFEGCSSLTAIEIPASLTTIDENDYERYSYHTSPFTGSAITDVSFEAGRTSIPWYLFADMTKLTGIRLPKSLKTINGEAFRGGVFRYAKAGDALRTVGAYAFAECPNLSYVYLPSAVETIDAHAFADSTGVTIIGERGSAAETFARANGIPFAATA